MTRLLSQVGEFGLIDHLSKVITASPKIDVGMGDDTAVIPFSASKKLLFTTDMLVEDVHFDLSMSLKSVGYKAMACSVSDIAAMGGVPQSAVASFGAPADFPLSKAKEICRGMDQVAQKFVVPIVGGDTVKSEKIIINIAMTGIARTKDIVLRSGAKVGDQIFVTGPLGNSFQSGWHLKFCPRVKESQFLVKNFKPSAMMDLSDGLASDIRHILKASDVGAMIEESQIPLRKEATTQAALTDGEDFELLFTLSPQKAKKLLATKEFPFYRIGEIDDGKGLRLRNKEGQIKVFSNKGFQHF